MEATLLPRNIPDIERDKNVWERSPTVAGAIGGIKGAIVGAPVVGFANALRGGSPLLGGVAGALGLGLLAALAAATKQRIENIDKETQLRYYADNLKSREPFFFMPPPNLMGKLFAAAHVRHTSQQAAAALAERQRPLRMLEVPNVYR